MSETHSKKRRTDIEEIKAVALRQMETGGPEGPSMNAVARELGLSGPALYRYVAGRDELISLLLIDGYRDFGAALRGSVEGVDDPREALEAAAVAYRSWALANPVRYQLCLGGPLAAYSPTPEVISQGLGSFAVLLDLVTQLLGPHVGPEAPLTEAVVGWARLHGAVSLELAGHLRLLGLDGQDHLHGEVVRYLQDLTDG